MLFVYFKCLSVTILRIHITKIFFASLRSARRTQYKFLRAKWRPKNGHFFHQTISEIGLMRSNIYCTIYYQLFSLRSPIIPIFWTVTSPIKSYIFEKKVLYFLCNGTEMPLRPLTLSFWWRHYCRFICAEKYSRSMWPVP